MNTAAKKKLLKYKKNTIKQLNKLKLYAKDVIKYKGVYLNETIVFFTVMSIIFVLVSYMLYKIAGILGLIVGVLWSWFMIVMVGLSMKDIEEKK